MSKVRVMNLGLQHRLIERRLRHLGVDLETLDLDEWLDDRLTLGENVWNLRRKLGLRL